jgi:outer membrane protein assembly factor BamD
MKAILKYSGIFLLDLLLIVLLLSSCSKFQKLQKSADVPKKLEAAFSYYDKKDYYRSSILLEELLPLLRGTEEAEKVQFYYAYTQYHLRMMETCQYLFKNFYDTYPRSIYSEESYFMHAISLYEDSPKYYLDQTNSGRAITAFENFMLTFPESDRKPKCQDLIEKLNSKLERKGFENAKLYSKRLEYKAAIIALENFTKDYPNSTFKEEAWFLVVQNAFRLANQSAEAKKLERFEQTLKFYQKFVDQFPKSIYFKTAENFYDQSTRNVERIKNYKKQVESEVKT